MRSDVKEIRDWVRSVRRLQRGLGVKVARLGPLTVGLAFFYPLFSRLFSPLPLPVHSPVSLLGLFASLTGVDFDIDLEQRCPRDPYLQGFERIMTTPIRGTEIAKGLKIYQAVIVGTAAVGLATRRWR